MSWLHLAIQLSLLSAFCRTLRNDWYFWYLVIRSNNISYISVQSKQQKVRIFSLIPQLQRIQPNFMTGSIRCFINTKQPNTQTQREQPKQRHHHWFHQHRKVCALTTKTTQTPILQYSYLNFPINRLHKQLDHTSTYLWKGTTQ